VISIAIVGGVALVVVLLTRGSFRQLHRLPIQAIWLVVVALVAQISLALVDIPADRLDDLGFGLVMVSYAFLLAFCFVNLRVSMMWVITLGIGLNALVIGLNQGMPTADREVTTRSGRTVDEPIERTAKHRPESDDDLLPFLGDRLRVPEPIDELLSIGDLVIGLGVVLVCYRGSRVRRPATTRAERMARIRERMRQGEAAVVGNEAAAADNALELQVQQLTPAPVSEEQALSHDSADDTLGVELKEVYSRLAADDHVRELPFAPDTDKPQDG
jgi:Family of unknown function (DUF5317)